MQSARDLHEMGALGTFHHQIHHRMVSDPSFAGSNRNKMFQRLGCDADRIRLVFLELF